MSTATYVTGDVFDCLAATPDGSVDLVLTSPPFLALRSYLPADHPDKAKEIGAERNPAEFVDTLLRLSAEFRRVLAPHGSIAVELGDTYSGGGGAGGDYADDGLRGGQPKFRQVGSREHRPEREGTGADGGDRVVPVNGGAGWPEAKSACLVPELYRVALAYGLNPITGQPSPAGRWRIRNTVRWCRPNPPVGALGDKFRPATSDMVIACLDTPQGQRRYFDLDAVREALAKPDAYYVRDNERYDSKSKRGSLGPYDASQSAGAPPLDWWELSTEPYVTPGGLLVVPSGETAHRVRVPAGAPADGIQRTVSADCPVHGYLDRSGSSAECGGRGDTQSPRTPHSDDRPDLGLPLDSAPTLVSPGQPGSTTEPPLPARSGAAIPHSTPSHRTALAPLTSPAGTPSAGTSDGTGDSSALPESSAPGRDTDGSSTDEACPPAGEPESEHHSAHRSDPSSACSCSYWVEISVVGESTSHYATWPDDAWQVSTEAFRGSHYATWPRKLLERPIKAMVPQRVCTVCGEPSRRIVEKSPEYAEFRATKERFANHTAWREAQGGARIDNAAAPPSGAAEYITLGWTDCGHDAWRPGLVLDPFGGSGTTLAVATGHGHNAIGFDLDPRNVDLATERVGPMFFTHLTLDQYRKAHAA